MTVGEIHRQCGTYDCDDNACYFVYWPGQSLFMCWTCAMRAAEVARVMGFALPMDTLPMLQQKLDEALAVVDATERLSGKKAL